jgi:hypothetical protein
LFAQDLFVYLRVGSNHRTLRPGGLALGADDPIVHFVYLRTGQGSRQRDERLGVLHWVQALLLQAPELDDRLRGGFGYEANEVWVGEPEIKHASF